MTVLEPTGIARERLLNYGAQGAGKTFAFFSILEKVDGRGFVIDTDGTVEQFLDGQRFAKLRDRVTWQTPDDWRQAQDLAEAYTSIMGPNDWLSFDRVDWLWDASQSYFSDQIFEKSIEEHMLAFRREIEVAREKQKERGESRLKQAGNPFEGFTDWPTIKKLHARTMMTLMRAKGHLYLAAAEKEVGKDDMEDTDVIRNYSRIGYRPAGEKTLGHLPRTVIRLTGSNPATWKMTTVKDRERSQVTGQPVSDFALNYLVAVAGWRPRMGG